MSIKNKKKTARNLILASSVTAFAFLAALAYPFKACGYEDRIVNSTIDYLSVIRKGTMNVNPAFNTPTESKSKGQGDVLKVEAMDDATRLPVYDVFNRVKRDRVSFKIDSSKAKAIGCVDDIACLKESISSGKTDSYIRQLAYSITAPFISKEEKAQALAAFVQSGIESRPKNEYEVKTPQQTLLDRWGNCLDKTALYISLLNTQNIESIVLYYDAGKQPNAVNAKKSSSEGHIAPAVRGDFSFLFIEGISGFFRPDNYIRYRNHAYYVAEITYNHQVPFIIGSDNGMKKTEPKIIEIR